MPMPMTVDGRNDHARRRFRHVTRPSRKLGLKDGRHFWLARVPANGRTILSYTRKPDPRPERDEEDEDEDEDDDD